MPNRTRKVVAYVLRDRDLLVFTQPRSPEAGLQVPAGTVREGEEAAAAALREVEEETGLSDVELVRPLGVQEYDMAAYGRDEIRERHVFELRVEGDLPSVWTHYEEHDGLAPPTPFEFSWRPLEPGLITELEAGQGALLDRVETWS